MYRLFVASIAAATCIAPVSSGIAQGTSSPAQAIRTLLDLNSVPTLSSERIVQLQQALQRKGFDPGPIDGVLGPMTRNAVRGYQDQYGMPATGEIDNQTLYALGGTELVGDNR